MRRIALRVVCKHFAVFIKLLKESNIGIIVCRVVVVVCGGFPLALDRAEGEVVLAHDFADTGSEEHGGARHAEVGVEVDRAHALGLALEERAVVGVDERGEKVCEHVLDAARVDLVACDAAHDGCVVELAPGGRRGGLAAVGVQGCAGEMEAAGGVGQHGKYCGVVGDKRVHECVGRDEGCDEEEQAVLHVVGGKLTDSTA